MHAVFTLLNTNFSLSFCNKLTSKLGFEEDSPAERFVLVLVRWLTELASSPDEVLLIWDPRSFGEYEVAEDNVDDDEEDGEDEDGECEWGEEPPVRLETTLIAVEDGRRLATAEVTSLSSDLIVVDSTRELGVEEVVRELDDEAEEVLLDPSASVIDIICNKVLKIIL